MTFSVSCTSPRELGKCPSVSETENIFANSHLHLCHHIGTSSIICRVFVQSERAFSVGRYQESDCRVEGQMWILLRVRLGRPGPASRGPRLSLSRNTCTCMHACMHSHTHTCSCPCCRAKHALCPEISQVRLPHFYVFIHIHPPPRCISHLFLHFFWLEAKLISGAGPLLPGSSITQP